ncbi:MAG: hypothetical protein WC747_00035 [Candidatus Babeliales bacterium]|jgi:hypothetical protein
MKKQLFFSLAILTVAAADLYAPMKRGGSVPYVAPKSGVAPVAPAAGQVSSVAQLKAKYANADAGDLASIALAAEHVASGLSANGDSSSQAYTDTISVLS